MDADLDQMSRDQLIAEAKKLREGIRQHRDSSEHELCWHHPALWGLLPEKTDPLPVVVQCSGNGTDACPQGKLIHALIRIGDSAVMLVDECPDWGSIGPKSLKGSPVTIHLYVEDVDSVIKRAVAAGAKVTMPLEDTFWGDRYGKLEDPFGHQWSFATHVRDVSPEELRQAAQKACG